MTNKMEIDGKEEGWNPQVPGPPARRRQTITSVLYRKKHPRGIFGTGLYVKSITII